MSKRLSRRLRFEVLRRDDHRCRYCGGTAPDVPLTVDHVVPIALGGTDEARNLVTACRDCNSGKSSVPADAPLVADVAADALRWAKALERAAWYRTIDRQVIQDVVRHVDHGWNDWRFGDENGDHVPRPSDWEDSIERFFNAGLTPEVMTHFIGVAMRNQRVPLAQTWSYFCGCCWREINALQDGARSLLDKEGERNGAI